MSATGEYRNPEAIHLRAASFRILCHAEIENFLEDISLELCHAAWSLWKDHGHPSHTLTCLLGFSDVSTTAPPEELTNASGSAYLDVSVPLEKANRVWRAAHRENHGVKEKNVLRLLLPIGIPSSALDQTLLNDLNSFGSGRGEVAHRSPTSVKTFLDPLSELESVTSLVAALRPLDQVIQREVEALHHVRRRLETSH